MTLLLASDLTFLLKYGYKLTGIPVGEMRIGYITTASKGDRGDFNRRLKGEIRRNGYDIAEIDIEGKTKEELRSFFRDKNIIHMEGGNTFYLLRTIRESGFAEILAEMLTAGKIYIGTSAGAYVMCPTIEVADWDETGKDRYGLTDFTALGYVPFVLKVHYKDEMEAKIREKMKSLKCPLRILRDGQGILVEDGKCAFVGDGEEVKIGV